MSFVRTQAGKQVLILIVKAPSYFNVLRHFIHSKNECGILIKTRKLLPLTCWSLVQKKRPLDLWGAGRNSLKLRCDCTWSGWCLCLTLRIQSGSVVTEEGFGISLYQQFSFQLCQTRSLRAASSCISAWKQELPAKGISELDFGF